jgi:hypothetical protein
MGPKAPEILMANLESVYEPSAPDLPRYMWEEPKNMSIAAIRAGRPVLAEVGPRREVIREQTQKRRGNYIPRPSV